MLYQHNIYIITYECYRYLEVADVAICGISLSSVRATVIEYLYPHWDDPSVMILRLSFDKSMYFIQPFTSNLWLAVGCVPAALSLIIFVFNRLSLWMRDNPIPGADVSKADIFASKAKLKDHARVKEEKREKHRTWWRMFLEYCDTCLLTYSIIFLQGKCR